MSLRPIQHQLKNKRIHEGTLLKRSKYLREWRQRWVVLTHSYLVTFTDSTAQHMTDVIQLCTLRSIKTYLKNQQEMTPCAFKLRTSQAQFYFSAREVGEKWTWIVVLQRLLHYTNSGLAKQGVGAAPYTRNQGFPPVDAMGAYSFIRDVYNTREQQVRKEESVSQRKPSMLSSKYSRIEQQHKNIQNNSNKMAIENKNVTQTAEQQLQRLKRDSLSNKQQLMKHLLLQFQQDSEHKQQMAYLMNLVIDLTTPADSQYRQAFLQALDNTSTQHLIQTVLEIMLNNNQNIKQQLARITQFIMLVAQNRVDLLNHKHIDSIQLTLVTWSKQSHQHKQYILQLLAKLHQMKPVQNNNIKAWLKQIAQNGLHQQKMIAHRILSD